jgi:beta-alanine--pyruvate transaminase
MLFILVGVLIPPEGYLKRIREICSQHGILLIFDEVITGFGRTGASWGTVKYDVNPDMITCAKGLTNATVPAGAVICQSHIFDTIHHGAHKNSTEMQIELFHGYTYSGHPLATAAGIATMDVYKEEGLFERAESLSGFFQEAMHSLKGLPNLIDIRNIGLMAAFEFTPNPKAPFKRAMDIMDKCFDKGLLVRAAGNTVAVAPPLIIEKKQIDMIIDILGKSIQQSAKEF